MEPAMPDTHLWITGAERAACADAATACGPAATVDCNRRLRGPYTGTGALMRALVPRLHTRHPERAARHAIEILAVAPELDPLIGPAPETLTSMASPEERTRWYSRYRTRRIAHGITDFLRECAAENPLTLAFCSVSQADPTDLEFLSIALRRLDPARVRLIVCSGQEVPGLDDALAAYARRQVVASTSVCERTRTFSSDQAAAFVAADGISDVPGEYEAYVIADPQLRMRLHDERAAELAVRAEWSLGLGVIPYHLERGSSPGTAGREAYAVAMLYTRLYGPEHKDHRKALAHVNTAIAIASQLEDPDDRAFHTVFMNNGKALVEMHLGNLAESLRLVSEGLSRLDRELPPEKHRLHRSVLNHNRGQVLAALGRPDEALADLGHVIEVDPHYPEFRFDRGNLLSRMGRYAEALIDYEAAMRLTPPFPELYYNRGDARAATGDIEGAMHDFRYVLDLEPDYLEARVSLASLLLDAGDPHAAAAQVRAGLTVTPGEARLHCTLGLALLDLQDCQEARRAFDRALELDPGLSEALVNRAIAAYEQGEPDVAVADLSAALEVDAGNPDLLSNRGLAHEAADHPEDAIADYTLALRDGRADRATLLYQRGRCYATLARLAEAHNDFNAHLALGHSLYEQEIRDLLENRRPASGQQGSLSADDPQQIDAAEAERAGDAVAVSDSAR